MELDHEHCYKIIAARDARFDGRFFMAVKTTGIYCRPVCPARTPRPHNVDFYASAAAAEQAGYRACKRCRPDAAPRWSGGSAVVGRALRLIEAGALDEGGVEALASRVGLGARQLHRLFTHHLGASPVAVAQTARAHFARGLIEQTALPMTEIAHAAGFGSLRRFNALIKQTFGEAPSALRAAGRSEGAGLVCRLPVRAPYDWEGLLKFLGQRAVAGVERVEGGVYRRTVRWAGEPGAVEVWRGGPDHLMVRALVAHPAGAMRLVARVRRMFDCDADPQQIGGALGADVLLAPLVAARPGLRLPSAWEPLEAAMRAILGQQVSVAAARTLAGRLVERCGEVWGEERLFPTAAQVAEAELGGLGLTGRRIEALKALARAQVEGRLDWEAPELAAQLDALPGIGPWTAQYILMRGVGDPDGFPSGDLVIRQMMAGVDVETRSEGWRPWRAYAALHLWAASEEA